MTAAAAASEALLEIEGQKLGNRSSLGERHGPWITYLSLTESLTHSLFEENAGAGAEHCPFMFQTLHAIIQDGLSLEFVAGTTGREFNIQDARDSRP